MAAMNATQPMQLDFTALPKSKAEIERERFDNFHEANPHVYKKLRDRALEIKRAGHNYWSINALVGWFRCEVATTTDSDDGLKINDHYAPFYSRMLMANETELAGFFKKRTSCADSNQG